MSQVMVPGLNPNAVRVKEAECGCKWLDGTVVGMCDEHWNEMQDSFKDE